MEGHSIRNSGVSFQRPQDLEDFHMTRKLNLDWENASGPTLSIFYIFKALNEFSSIKDVTAHTHTHTHTHKIRVLINIYKFFDTWKFFFFLT